MKKWAKRIVIGLLFAFAYLGTGYQFAVTNWDAYQKTKFEGLDPAGRTRLDHEALWPATTEMAPPQSFKSKDGVALIVGFSETERGSYIRWTMSFWGFKVLWNVFWIAIAIPVVKLLFLFYYVAGSFLNFILAPFGAHIPLL